VPIKFRQYSDTWIHGARDYSTGICTGVMVIGGFMLSVLQISHQAFRELHTLRIKDYTVSKSIAFFHLPFFLCRI